MDRAVRQSQRDALLVQALAPVPDAQAVVSDALDTGDGPLLSVVMRTRLHRPEALREALESLRAQRSDRYELILVVHDADLSAAERLFTDSGLPGSVIASEGGTRSRPLNDGIRHSRGSHIAFLDDDDLVHPDWVQVFLDGAQQHPGRLLRASAAVQRMTTHADGSHEAVGDAEITYPEDYDLADHLRVNRTPFMAFAFPRGFFAVFGGADESLAVCEDWDLGLRAAVVLGVADLHRVTAVYRRWDSGDSYTSHSAAEWEHDMNSVRAKLDAVPLLLPPGSATVLAGLSADRVTAGEVDAVRSSTSWRVTAPLRAVAGLFSRRKESR